MTTRTLVQVAATGMWLFAAGCAAVDPPPLPTVAASRTESAPPQGLPQAGSNARAEAESSSGDGAAYDCDNGLTVHARFREDTLTLSGLPQGEETLLRDAGGVTPEQTVWSNDRLRAEFGLPPDTEGAAVHLLQPQLSTLHCRRAPAAVR